MGSHHDHGVRDAALTGQNAGQGDHGGQGSSAAQAHGGHGNAGHGDHVAQFRDRLPRRTIARGIGEGDRYRMHAHRGTHVAVPPVHGRDRTALTDGDHRS
jgi:hypothetical protein